MRRSTRLQTTTASKPEVSPEPLAADVEGAQQSSVKASPKSVAKTAAQATKPVAKKAVQATKPVAKKTAQATKPVTKKAADATKPVTKKAADATKPVAKKATGGTKRTKPESKSAEAPAPKRKVSNSSGVVLERTKIAPKPIPDGVSALRFISWNVNGLRAIVKKSMDQLKGLVETEKPDVLCLQETKLQDIHVDEHRDLLPGYTSFWSCSTVKKGYAGTSVFIRNELVKDTTVTYGIGDKTHDGEGRSITVEFPNVFLVALYVPNSGIKLERLDYRTTSWDPALIKYVKELESTGKPVVITGDLNVAHLDIDIHNPTAKHIPKTSGCTKAERDSFTKFLEEGFVDSFREMNNDAVGAFTYWSMRAGNRQWNKGLRLDYFVCSKDMMQPAAKAKLFDSYVLESITPTASDHCPIGAVVVTE